MAPTFVFAFREEEVFSFQLNYNKFVDDGEKVITEAHEYHSHNTYQLNENELKELLLDLHEIKNELKDFGIK